MKTISKKELTSLLGNFIAVENCIGRNGSGKAPNQFRLKFEHGEIFQSYRSLIGAKVNGQLYLTDLHDYSNTTSAHCSRWCGLNTDKRRKGIKDEEITMITE